MIELRGIELIALPPHMRTELTVKSVTPPGLHHFCLRVDSEEDVHVVANQLRAFGVDATEARRYPQYTDDYTPTFFESPDGIRLEVTNYRQERRDRHDYWDRGVG